MEKLDWTKSGFGHVFGTPGIDWNISSTDTNKYRQDLIFQLQTPGKLDWDYFMETVKKARELEENE
jgi:hypothetical protein